jgi:phosphopantetheinyl transferase (holo-ACP synthase)
MSTENATELDETELFNNLTSDEPAETQQASVETEQVTEETGQSRDEAGRFAAKEAQKATEEQAEQQDHGNIPSWRLREETEARRLATQERDNERAARAQLERELQSLRKPVEQEKAADRPDPLLDPEGYERHLETKFEQRLINERRESSLELARRTYKTDFDEAYKAAQQTISSGDRTLMVRMNQSRDPGETLMEWHKELKVRQEVGTDPNAWLEKQLEARMKDPAFVAKVLEQSRGTAQTTNSSGRPIVKLPPSLNGASRANAQLRAVNDDLPDEELFQQITG